MTDAKDELSRVRALTTAAQATYEKTSDELSSVQQVLNDASTQQGQLQSSLYKERVSQRVALIREQALHRRTRTLLSEWAGWAGALETTISEKNRLIEGAQSREEHEAEERSGIDEAHKQSLKKVQDDHTQLQNSYSRFKREHEARILALQNETETRESLRALEVLTVDLRYATERVKRDQDEDVKFREELQRMVVFEP